MSWLKSDASKLLTQRRVDLWLKSFIRWCAACCSKVLLRYAESFPPPKSPLRHRNDWVVKIGRYTHTKWKFITASGQTEEGVWKWHEKRDLLSKRVLRQRLNWCAATHRQKVTEIIILLIGNLGPNDALNFYGIHSDSIQIPELFKRRFLAWEIKTGIILMGA